MLATYSFRSRQVLITNGKQTMGVGLPWAIAASLVRPSEKVISIFGDGGFMFSSMELETAVRLKCNLHLVWMDGHYDMVRFKQIAKYGRDAAVEFGSIDVAGIARASGAHGMKIHRQEEICTDTPQGAGDAGGRSSSAFPSTIATTTN